MKCTRLLDWYEEHFEDTRLLNKNKVDMAAHLHSCPDCLSAMKDREMLLAALRELPDPTPPCNLPAQIMQSLDVGLEETEINDISTGGIIDGLLERCLQPIQVVLSLACVLTCLSIVLSQDLSKRIDRCEYAGFAHKAAVRQSTHAIPKKNDEFAQNHGLVRLSDAEITAFMHKLEDYKKSQVELDAIKQSLPQGILVKDR